MNKNEEETENIEILHLVVLVHGLWGNRSHMGQIREHLEGLNMEKGKNTEERLVIHETRLNEGYKTYDGIDICGIRVAKEIEELLLQYGGSVKKFSLIGYSLGGLICRYALGVLYQSQLFKKNEIELVNFTTFCTPHVGVLAPGNNAAVNIFNSLTPLLLGNSGKQMFLKDNYRGYPLIYLMSLPNSIFYKALQQFRYRALYANIINDKRTAWWTAGISRNDPFIDVDEYNAVERFHYVKGYDPVVLNHESSLRIIPLESSPEVEPIDSELSEPMPVVDSQDFYFLNYWFIKIVRWITVFINLIIIAPIWCFWFIITGIMETIKSGFRVTTFAKKYSHFFITEVLDMSTDQREIEQESSEEESQLFAQNSNIYEKQIEQSLTDQRDTLIESLFEAIERKDTHTATVENINAQNNDILTLNTTIKQLELYSIDEIISGSSMDSEKSSEFLSNFHLDIGKQQIEIIDSLNKLEWEKFPLYIRKTTSTHAAAIIRHSDPKFVEGKVVLQHFVANVFKTS